MDERGEKIRGGGKDCHVIPGRKFEAHRDSKFPINQILRGDNRILNGLDISLFSLFFPFSLFSFSLVMYRLPASCDIVKCILLGKLEFSRQCFFRGFVIVAKIFRYTKMRYRTPYNSPHIVYFKFSNWMK